MASAQEQKFINAIRILAADTVERANSGHPGACAFGWSRAPQAGHERAECGVKQSGGALHVRCSQPAAVTCSSPAWGSEGSRHDPLPTSPDPTFRKPLAPKPFRHRAGAPMGCAPIAHVLFSKIMKYNPADPKWVRCSATFRSGARYGGQHPSTTHSAALRIPGVESAAPDRLSPASLTSLRSPRTTPWLAAEP
jgi:hypothetical protein